MQTSLDDKSELIGPAGLWGPGRFHVRLQTLVLVRWIAIFGQTITVLSVQYGFGFQLPFVACLSTIVFSIGLNVFISLIFPFNKTVSARMATFYLTYDLLQLAALLYLTGGLENPFIILMLVPITVSATILPTISTVFLGWLSIFSISLLAFFHFPLPGPDLPVLDEGLFAPFIFPDYYIGGVWTAMVVGVVCVGTYAHQVAGEAQRMSAALSATQAALAREQQLAAVGGLAASAAHELGTPLGTITLIASELRQELEEKLDDAQVHEDLDQLVEQAKRCKTILGQLMASPQQQDKVYSRVPLSMLLEEVSRPLKGQGIEIHIQETARDEDGHLPQAKRQPEVIHGLANLIENAVDFAKSRVDLEVNWDDLDVRVVISDDGPGFSAEIFERLGMPYVSSRKENVNMRSDSRDLKDYHGGMGLGVFISKTLLEHSGATIRFGNKSEEPGAIITITWPRDILAGEIEPTPNLVTASVDAVSIVDK